MKTDLILPQCFVCLAVTLLMVQLGLIAGWSSPNLERLRKPNSSISLNESQLSWVSSLVDMGFSFGCIPGSISLSYFGSRQSIVNTLIPMSLGWLGIIFANSALWLYAARLVSGLGIGMMFCIFPIYVGEVSIPETRGSFMFVVQIGFPVGMVLASICEPLFNMSSSATGYFVFCILLICIFYKLPESPYHLVTIAKLESAKKSIDWYRSGQEVEKELDSVEKFVASIEQGSLWHKFGEFRKPQVRMAMLQVVILLCSIQLCGLDGFLFNMETIANDSKFALVQPSNLVIFVNTMGIFASVVSIFLIDRFGRRVLMVISSTGVFFSLLILVIHHSLIRMDVDVENLQLLPAIALSLYISFINIGIAPVPNTLVGEMLPSNNKYLCACIATFIGAAMAFVTAKTYQPLVGAVGYPYTFSIYMFFAALIVPYALFFMMETKGKSLQQIQEELSQRYS